jgi:lysozyme
MQKRTTAGAVCSVGAIIALVLSMGLGVRTNKDGLELIGNAEGCYRDPYRCPADVWTDGLGNTHGVKPGVRKTDEQIAKDWAANIREAERCINENFRGSEMNDNQFSAMTSAAFNLGCRGVMTYVNGQGKRVPTTIWRHAAAARWPEMCDRLTDFTRAGGRVLPGLVTRGVKQRALCFKPVEG